jgi:GDP-L-fucose synthase
MKILVTGSSGMVGQNVKERFEYENVTLIMPTSNEMNLSKYQDVVTYLSKNKPDIIIHAAGKVGGIQANMLEPVSFLVDNLDMGRNIVSAAKELGIRKLINLGSSCMYPRNLTSPLREEDILTGELEPTNEGYALAKIATSKLCEYIQREDDSYQYKTLIPCNLYGRWDKFDPVHSHMIAGVIDKIYKAKIEDRKEVVIWGDGLARREFMYAGADCLLTAVTNFDHLPSLMNVGLGYDYTINQYYEIIADILGYTGTFSHDLSKPSGMKQKLVHIGKQSEWGWKASTTLEDGIRKTYSFYLEQKEQ